ncbi:MAG: glycosyltransferase [Legionellales bacterium]|nr:glycosyltransferase [Legionellales bacterium]
MHVIHIYKTYFPDTHGGVERVIYNLTRYTSKQGIKNTIVTVAKKPGIHYKEGVKIIQLPLSFEYASCPISLSLFQQYHDVLSEADILHYHAPWPYADFCHMIKGINKPTILTYHSDIIAQKWLKIPYQLLFHAFMKKVDSIIATSHPYLESSRDLAPYQHKTKVIPIGIDPTAYPSLDMALVNKWRTQVEEGFALFIGVLRYYKGLKYLLQALKDTQIPLVIAGSGYLNESLKKQTKQLGLNKVNFVGQISEEDKIALLYLSGVFITPSHLRSEAFCIGLLEALMMGKPLISCEIGTGTSFINQHKQTGLIIPPANPAAIQNALQTILTNSVLAKDFGKASKERFDQYFTIDNMGEKYMEEYQRLFS